MKRALDSLTPFQPIGSIDALHPMEIDASGSLSPMQKRHKSFRHKNGGKMSLEEIYTFAGWMPHTWLDPSNKAKSDSSSEAKVSASNSQYQTTSLLPSSTPLGWNNRVTEDDDTKRRRDDLNADQIEAIRQTMLMDTGGSTMMPSSDDTSSGAQMDSQTAQQDDAELIPRSMSDIYKISIQNRNKRDNNKSNGAVDDQEDVVEDENLQDVDVDDETPMFPNSTAKSSAEESDVVFMTRLGWVEQGTEMYGRVKRAEASGKGGVGGGDGEKDGKKKSRRTNRSSKKKGARNDGSSYDYGQSTTAYGAGQHGKDTNSLHRNITQGGSGGRGRRTGGASGRGGRGGRSFGGSEDRSSRGSGGRRGGRRNGGRSKK